MIKLLRLFAIASIVMAGCKARKTTHSTPPASRVQADDPDLAIAISIWPAHWEAVRGFLRTNPELAPFTKIDMTSLPSALTSLASTAGIGDFEFPPGSIAKDRPVTFQVTGGNQPFLEVVLAAFAGTSLTGSEGTVPSVRLHLPSDDPTALKQKIIEATKKDFNEVLPGRLFFSSEWALRLGSVDAGVAVQLSPVYLFSSTNAEGLKAGFGPLAKTELPIAFLAGNESAARVRLRLKGLGKLGTLLGAHNMYGASAQISNIKERPLLVLEGASELLIPYLLHDPERSFARNVYVNLSATSNVSAAFLVTPSGLASVKAAGIQNQTPVPSKKVNWDAAIEAATIPPLFDTADSDDDVMSIVGACGWPCSPQFWMGNVLQTAHAFRKKGGDLLAEQIKWIKNTDISLRLENPELLVLAKSRKADKLPWASLKIPAKLDSKYSAADRCSRNALLAVYLTFAAVAESVSNKPALLSAANALVKEQEACAQGDPTVKKEFDAAKSLLNELKKMAESANKE